MKTKFPSRRLNRFVIAAVCAAALSACGGGGDDSSSTATASGTAAASGDPIDKYLGTITSNCEQEAGVVDAKTGAVIHEKAVFLAMTKTSATRATVTFETDFFDTADCSGTPRYVLTLSGPDNFINVDGTVMVGTQNVDKMTGGTGVYFPNISAGGKLTVQGLTFQGSDYNRQSAVTSKTIWLLDANGALTIGDSRKPLDAQGYPTLLQAAPSAKKT